MAVELVDALLRQQVYLEMWKEWEAKASEQQVNAIIAGVIAALAAYREDMTRVEIRALIETVNRKANGPLVALTKSVEDMIKDAIKIVTQVTMHNYNQALDTDRKRIPGNKASRAKAIQETPLGTGLTTKEMLGDFAAGFIKKVRTGIEMAYANKWTIQELLRYIKGTAAKGFRDGLLNKLKNEIRALVKTAMQHVQTWVDYNVGKLFFNFYQWISILDSRTTDICRSRHRNVYQYGRGPLPPAHYNCRSRIMAVAADMSNQIPNDFFDWLRRQPDAFLADALLPEDLERVRNGTARRQDFPGHRNVKTANAATFGKRASVSEN